MVCSLQVISNNTEQIFLSGGAVILLFLFLPSVLAICFGYFNVSVWDWQVPLTMAGSCCSGILLYHQSFLFAAVIKLVSSLVLLSGIKLNDFVIHFHGWALLTVK